VLPARPAGLHRQSHLHVLVGTHAHEYGVVLFQQGFDFDVLADFGIQHEFHAHALHDFATALNNGLFQLEFRDAEGEQAADFFVAVVYHRLHAVAYQHVGTGKACRAGADDGDFLVAPDHLDMSGRQPAL
jgi:hypothetical protein